jgi:hypothetical protein
MFSKAWSRAVTAIPAAAIAASGLAFAPQAEAQTSAPTIGQCVAPAVISEQLKAQGQRTVFEADRSVIINGKDNKHYAAKLINAFTSNPSGSMGYSVRECFDNTGKSTGQLQAEMKFNKVKLYDERFVTAVNNETLVTTSRELAEKACQTSRMATCGYHNDIIKNGFKAGSKVVYQATSADGRIITVDSKSDKTGSIQVTNANDGSITFAFSLSQANYTEYAQTIGKRIPVDTNIAAAPSGSALALR